MDRRNPQGEGYGPGEDSTTLDWLREGEAALSAGELDKARRCLEQVLQWNPFEAKAHSGLGIVCQRQGRIEDAVHSLTRALELDPNAQQVILDCSGLFEELGRTDDAREILEAYMTRNPGDDAVKRELERLNRPHAQGFDAAAFFLDQGEQQFERGEGERARVCFEMAIEHNPKLAQAHSNLGVLYWNAGEMDKALASLYRAFELAPDDRDILYNSYKVLVASGDTATGVDLLRIYLQKNPGDEEAWQDYTTLLSKPQTPAWQPDGLSPDVAGIYMRMGAGLAEAHDFVGAAEAFDRALQLNPQDAEGYWQLGKLHLALDQSSEAAELLREGLRIDPLHRASLLAWGGLAASREHLQEVRDLCERYLAHESDEGIQELLERVRGGLSGPL